MAPFKCAFQSHSLKRVRPTETEKKREDSDLWMSRVSHYQETQSTVGVFKEVGPGLDLATHHLAGQETVPVPE